MTEDLRLFATPRARVLVLVAATLLVLVRLDASDLWPPDEPRYALVAEELRSMENGASGLVLLHLHGKPYTQKPPLFYWLAAAAGAPFGRVTEFAARLPSALAGVATVAATIAMGSLLFGRGAGALAGLLLATTFDWSYRARTVQLDTLLALFETTALLAFWRIEAGIGTRRRNLLALHGSLALAVLSKGPIGWIIPLLGIAGYLGWERRLRELRGLLPLWGLALSILPALVWISASVALGPPGFFHDAVIDNLFGRALGGTAHSQPFYYYIEKFPPDLMPWLLLLPVAIWVGRRALAADASPNDRRAWRFLLAWIATSVLFFSLSSGKRLRYLLTIEPAFALLFAATLRDWFAHAPSASRVLAIFATALGVTALVATGVFAWLDPFDEPVATRGLSIALVAIVVLGALAWQLLARRGAGPESRVVVLAACTFGVQMLAYAVAMPVLDSQNSPLPIADAAAALARPGEAIGLYRGHDIADAITYYERRPTWTAGDASSLTTFYERGGRVVVLEEEDLAHVESVAPVVVRARFRMRRDPWLVVVRTGPPS